MLPPGNLSEHGLPGLNAADWVAWTTHVTPRALETGESQDQGTSRFCVGGQSSSSLTVLTRQKLERDCKLSRLLS